MNYKTLSLIAFIVAGLFLPFSCGALEALFVSMFALLLGVLLHVIGKMQEPKRKGATQFDDIEWHKGL